MKCSAPGQFYGETNGKISLDGIVLDDSYYTMPKVDWHYHEHPYFTFLLQGGVVEGSRKGRNECTAGSLLFHNSENPHYNLGTNLLTRGFHIEIRKEWFERFEIPPGIAAGTVNIADPALKMLMYQVFRETKSGEQHRQAAIDALMIRVFDQLSATERMTEKKRPGWVKIIREALHTDEHHWQLTDLAKLANIHPVYLCREFPKHFHANLGDYLRMIKVEKALALLPDKTFSLTDISILCGFSDQSHFIRSFKSLQQIAPLQYRKLMLKDNRG